MHSHLFFDYCSQISARVAWRGEFDRPRDAEPVCNPVVCDKLGNLRTEAVEVAKDKSNFGHLAKTTRCTVTLAGALRVRGGPDPVKRPGAPIVQRLHTGDQFEPQEVAVFRHEPYPQHAWARISPDGEPERWVPLGIVDTARANFLEPNVQIESLTADGQPAPTEEPAAPKTTEIPTNTAATATAETAEPQQQIIESTRAEIIKYRKTLFAIDSQGYPLANEPSRSDTGMTAYLAEMRELDPRVSGNKKATSNDGLYLHKNNEDPDQYLARLAGMLPESSDSCKYFASLLEQAVNAVRFSKTPEKYREQLQTQYQKLADADGLTYLTPEIGAIFDGYDRWRAGVASYSITPYPH